MPIPSMSSVMPAKKPGRGNLRHSGP